MAERRQKGIGEKRTMLTEIKGKTRDVVKRREKLECEIEELVTEDQIIRENTERQLIERELGYRAWKAA
jgi:hypothetical protein